jgi:glycosyltransferase involved in cell wall biosynthesis
MESVLSQTFADFRLVVSDNASDDDTGEVVASFADSRVDYRRCDENIGMVANFNRLIGLAETELFVLLPDDDLLYPDHLGSVVEALDSRPEVGVVHTAFDLVDAESRVVESSRKLLRVSGRLTVESGHRFLVRSMKSSWIMCFSSATYRTAAIVGAGGFRAVEEPFSDVPMWMRLALDWDVAFVPRTLAAVRVHGSSVTAALGSFADGRIDVPGRSEILRDHRLAFLEEAKPRLGRIRFNEYRALAARTYRDETVQRVANDAGTSRSWTAASKAIVQLVRTDPPVLALPRTWKLFASQLGGRWALRGARRLVSVRRPPRPERNA